MVFIIHKKEKSAFEVKCANKCALMRLSRAKGRAHPAGRALEVRRMPIAVARLDGRRVAFERAVARRAQLRVELLDVALAAVRQRLVREELSVVRVDQPDLALGTGEAFEVPVALDRTDSLGLAALDLVAARAADDHLALDLLIVHELFLQLLLQHAKLRVALRWRRRDWTGS